VGVYVKSSGGWIQKTGRPHLKVNGQWMPVKEGHVKQAGVWTEFYNYDVTPPQAPQLELTEVNPQYNYGGALRLGRYINVTTAPAVVDDTIKRILVLVSTSYQPSSPFDAPSFISIPGAEAPGEPWSELGYNGYLTSRPLTGVSTKRFTANQADSSVLPGGTYYVSAWAQDWAGNWSDGTYDSITLTNAFDVTQTTSHVYNGRATSGGTYQASTNNYSQGDMDWTASPVRNAVWFYGTQFANAIASAPINATITSMKVYLHRKAVDKGPQASNLYLTAHGFNSGAEIEAAHGFFLLGASHIGTLAKGEGKWFDVPASMYSSIITGGAGLALVARTPGMTSFSQGTLNSVSTAVRQGEIQMTWTSEASA